MAVDYVKMMQGNEANEANTSKRVHAIGIEAVKPKRLTKKKKTASMKKRQHAEKKTMAKGKKGKSKGKKGGGKKKAPRGSHANGKRLAKYNELRAAGKTKAEARTAVGWDTGKPKAKKPKKKGKSKARSKTKSVSTSPRTSKKSSRKSKAAKKRSGKSGSKSKKRGRRTSFRATTTRGSTTINVRVPTQPARRSKPRKAKSKGGKKKGKSKAKGKKKTSGGGRAKGAMENPMTGVELFVGAFTGLLGFGTADVVDRLIATHALTAAAGSTTSFTDTPPTASPAQGTAATYGSLYNSTAVCAPMNLTRWGVGLGIFTAVPIIIAHFVSAPVGRSALQFFGFGAGMRIVGKGMIDLLALITKSNQTGMRLYEGEQRAAAILKNDGSVSTLPTQSGTGLGRGMLGQPRQRMLGHANGCGCKNCGKVAAAQAPALAAKPQTGAGYPSYPAPVPASQQTPNGNAPVNAVPVDQTANQNIGIQGVPPTMWVPAPGSSWNRAA